LSVDIRNVDKRIVTIFVEMQKSFKSRNKRAQNPASAETCTETWAFISAPDTMNPGTVRLMLSMFDVSVALKARVKYAVESLGMGVEFQEIRRGDRPLLSYVLTKLRTRRVEDYAPVEMAREALPVAG
jgi:hypothetical protein